MEAIAAELGRGVSREYHSRDRERLVIDTAGRTVAQNVNIIREALLELQRNMDSPDANSIYHAGFVTLNKRFRNPYGVMVKYTWSKSIDNQTTIQYATGPQSHLRIDLDHALSDNNVAHRFIVAGLVDSPFHNFAVKDWNFWLTAALQSPRNQPVLMGSTPMETAFLLPTVSGCSGATLTREIFFAK